MQMIRSGDNSKTKSLSQIDRFFFQCIYKWYSLSTICRHTGCSSVIISDAVLPDAIITGVPNVDVYDYLGRKDTFPVVKCYLRCPYFNGWVNEIHAPIKFCSVLVGNIPGVIDDANVNDIPSTVQGVVTRSS